MRMPKILSSTENHDALKKIPLLELAGYNRVIIENHSGVMAYSSEEIQIRVSYGAISVSGTCLNFKQISKEQLVITGQIDSIKLFRR